VHSIGVRDPFILQTVATFERLIQAAGAKRLTVHGDARDWISRTGMLNSFLRMLLLRSPLLLFSMAFSDRPRRYLVMGAATAWKSLWKQDDRLRHLGPEALSRGQMARLWARVVLRDEGPDGALLYLGGPVDSSDAWAAWFNEQVDAVKAEAAAADA
jgi:hypothetical protein